MQNFCFLALIYSFTHFFSLNFILTPMLPLSISPHLSTSPAFSIPPLFQFLISSIITLPFSKISHGTFVPFLSLSLSLSIALLISRSLYHSLSHFVQFLIAFLFSFLYVFIYPSLPCSSPSFSSSLPPNLSTTRLLLYTPLLQYC